MFRSGNLKTSLWHSVVLYYLILANIHVVNGIYHSYYENSLLNLLRTIITSIEQPSTIFSSLHSKCMTKATGQITHRKLQPSVCKVFVKSSTSDIQWIRKKTRSLGWISLQQWHICRVRVQCMIMKTFPNT